MQSGTCAWYQGQSKFTLTSGIVFLDSSIKKSNPTAILTAFAKINFQKHPKSQNHLLPLPSFHKTNGCGDL